MSAARGFVLSLLLSGGLSAGHGQLPAPDPENSHFTEFIYHTGVYWSRTEYLEEQFSDGYRAFEARFGLQTTGTRPWHLWHNYPRYGMGVHYADLVKDPSDTIVGNPFSAFAFYSAPWVQRGRFTLATDLALGLSYTSLVHDPVDNPYNDVIASHLNLYFDFNLNLRLKLTSQLALKAGYGVTHYSNGRIHEPQKGVNNWGWIAGLSYHPGRSRVGRIIPETPEFQSREEIQLMAAAGVVEHHKLGEEEGVHYFTSSVTADYAVTFNPRMAVSLGLDVMYDGSLVRAVKGVPPPEVTTFQKTYFGSHLGYHFLIDRVTILFNLGTYFLQQTYDRGAWFIRAGGRVRLTGHLHTQICIKTKNGVRADWIEWGMVYTRKVR